MPVGTVGKGIKKVSENVLINGRAIIVTEQNKDLYAWTDIPVGSKFINTKTGDEFVKLEGQTDWVPCDVKQDNTINIAKDSIIKKEVFTITNPDNGDGTFTYRNTNNQERKMPFNKNGYLFELEEGVYSMFRNHLEVTIDDCITRDTISGGIEEINCRRFILNYKDLIASQEITAKYIEIFRIGNPYPRFFIHDKTPEDGEIGDFWLDTDATLADVDCTELNIESNNTLPWYRLTGVPTTLKDFGLKAEVEQLLKEYKFSWSQITDPPVWPPKEINATSLQNHLPGIAGGNVFLIPSDGKIPLSMIPDSIITTDKLSNSMDKLNIPAIFIQSTQPPAQKNAIWINTSTDNMSVNVSTNGSTWFSVSEVWQ